MEKKEANKEPFNRPDGVEVKLTAKSINIRGFLFFFILFLIGSYLFVYVWDEPSSYSAGRLLGTSVKGISSPQVMLCIFLLRQEFFTGLAERIKSSYTGILTGLE